tara:strand:+ start:273 stop:500 length:228 start_codon:yes stop_codon:yes gene_type:complete
MSNSKEDYNNYIRANLPTGMSFSSDRYRYNNHSFATYKQAKWYYDYIHKTEDYLVEGTQATLVLDFELGFFATNV